MSTLVASRDSAARRLARFGVATLAAGAAVLAIAVWVDALGEPVCALRRIAGIPCPTCGMTRALAALAHGRWAESLGWHPLALPLAIEGIVIWIIAAVAAMGGRGWGGRWRVHAVLANVGVLVVVWIVRLANGWRP